MKWRVSEVKGWGTEKESQWGYRRGEISYFVWFSSQMNIAANVAQSFNVLANRIAYWRVVVCFCTWTVTSPWHMSNNPLPTPFSKKIKINLIFFSKRPHSYLLHRPVNPSGSSTSWQEKEKTEIKIKTLPPLSRPNGKFKPDGIDSTREHHHGVSQI